MRRCRDRCVLGMALLVATLLLAVTQPVAADHDPSTDTPDSFCTGFDGPVPLTVELARGGVPLPRDYSNPTGDDVTFTLTMNENMFFGPTHVVGTVHLDAHRGLHSSESPIVPVTGSTPLGTDRVTVDITSDATGSDVLARCDYTLSVVPPAEMADLIQVPVRWCAVEGTPQAGDAQPGETIGGEKLLALLGRVSDEVFLPGAHVSFRPASANQGIPVVRDPNPDNFQLGDLALTGFGGGEWGSAAYFCEEAWAARYPDQRGVLVVNGRVIIPETVQTVGGAAFAPSAELWANHPFSGPGERVDDLCAQPRGLLVSDVVPLLQSTVYDQALFGGASYSGETFEPAKVLAHELGHTVMLAHGNGFDDNGDGTEPPDLGRRSFDEYCDPLGNDDLDNFPDEDEGISFTSCEETGSLMQANRCTNLRLLQREMLRAAAKLAPGAVFEAGVDPSATVVGPRACAPPCDLPPDVFLLRLDYAETPGAGVTSLSHTVFGSPPATATNVYAAFADLDNNLATGCPPSALGFPGGFQGAELVTRVAVAAANGSLVPTPTVWRCQSGALVQSTDPGITASLGEVELAAHTPGEHGSSAVVRIDLPNAVRGPAADVIRLQAFARQTGGATDLLPPAGTGAVVSLQPPELPVCSVRPVILRPGEGATVAAEGLSPSAAVRALLGGERLGDGSTDADGSATVAVTVPASATRGLRQVSVLEAGTGNAAACALVVEGSPTTPATVARVVPAPNGGGWNRTDVDVILTATDVPGGPGIDGITYRATGATSLDTTASGASVAIPITAEGVTTIRFFATSLSGAQEAPRTVTVMLDKTKPTIAGTRQPGPNSFGWNNVNVVVTFSCADVGSGVISCPSPKTLSGEGAGQSVTGVALDAAFNTESATVGGINIDKTRPTVTYSGNAGTYGLLDTIDITCTATDELSGVASTTCQDIEGPAYTFAAGTNSFSAEATDRAGNVGVGSTSFQLRVTYDDLCALTRAFISTSQLTPEQARLLGESLCSKLDAAKAAEIRGATKTRRNQINAYIKQVEQNTPAVFTRAQSETLVRFARSCVTASCL